MESEDEEVFMDSGPTSQDERKPTDAEEETLESQSEDDDEYLPSSLKKRVKVKKTTSQGAAKVKISKDNVPLSCSMCPILFKNPQSLRVHMCTKHPNRDKQLLGTKGIKQKAAPLESSKTKRKNPKGKFRTKYDKGDTSKEFSCNICSASYVHKHNLLRHMRDHDKMGDFPCAVCGIQLLNARSLRCHMLKMNHFAFKCKTCGDPFSDGDLLAQHMTTHITDSPSTSATTPREDTEEEEEEEEEQHEEEAEDDKTEEEEDETGVKLRCAICPKIFTKLINLRKHAKMHAAAGPQPCPYCGKVYTNINGLKGHVHRHRRKEIKSLSGEGENEKPVTPTTESHITRALLLPCKQCPKEFSTIHNLLLHKKCHTSKGPINCPFCDSLLKNVDSLRGHLNKQHRNKIKDLRRNKIKKEPSPTPKAESTNDDESDGDSQASSEQGSGTLACPYCGKLHSSISTLYAHVLRHKEKLEKENLKEKENTPVESDATSESGELTDNTKDTYKCTTCDKVCATAYHLKKHMEVHAVHDSVHASSLPCPYCEKVYDIRSSLNSHICRSHNDEWKKSLKQKTSSNNRSCDQCSKVFGSKSSLWCHKKSAHGNKHLFPCRHCKKLFKDSSTLKAHMQNHRQELKIRISLTTKSVKLSASNEPYKLRAKIESNDVDNMETEEDASRSLKCPKCSETFTKRSTQLRHIKAHNKKGSHVCKTCGLRFSNIKNLKIHQHHRQHTDTPQDTKLSPELLKKNSSRVEKNMDQSECNKRKPFQCPRCSAAYADKGTLSKHIQLHRRKGNIMCPNCGVRFNSERSMKIHARRVHNKKVTMDDLTSPKIPKLEGVKTEKFKTEENVEETSSCKLYRCSRCPTYFNNKYTTLRHIRRHDIKGAIACPTCGLRFPTQHAVNTHNYTHKSMRCVICYTKMEDENELALHLKEIHKTSQSKAIILKVGVLRKRRKGTGHVSGTSCTCPICSKVLSNSANLRVHMGIHTTGPVKCPLCGIIYKNNPSMYKHFQTNHKEVDLKELGKDFKPWLSVVDYQKFLSAKEEKEETNTSGKSQKELKNPVAKSTRKDNKKTAEFENYSCDKCEFSCEEKYKIRKHMKCHMKRGHLKCDFCTKRFTNGIALKAHIWTHNGINCILCNHTCSDEEQLALHMRNVHKVYRKVKLEPNAIIVSDVEETGTVPRTKEEIPNESLKVVDPSTINETAFLCSHCNEMIIGENTFERHMRRKHNIEHKISANVLASHMVPIKLPKKPERQQELPMKPLTPTAFYCDICKEKFNDKDTRTRHIKEIHFGIKTS